MGEALSLIQDKGVLPLPEKEVIGFLSLGDVDGEAFYKALSKERSLERINFSGGSTRCKTSGKKPKNHRCWFSSLQCESLESLKFYLK